MPSYIDLARHNAKNEVDLKLYNGDITLRSTMSKIGVDLEWKVDVFIINHVLEHIYDTVGLMQSIDYLGHDKSMIVFDVPNGFSITSFLAEGHTGTFGVSLADPDCWHYFGNPRARIYYRRFEYYLNLFEARGFKISLVRPPKLKRVDMVDKLLETMVIARDKASSSVAPRHIVAEAMDRFESEVNYDIDNATDEELDLKYFHYFWRGVAYRSSTELAPDVLDSISPTIWNIP